MNQLLLSVTQAAATIGCAPSTVRGLVARGELTATKDATGQLWFEPADVAAIPLRKRGGQHQDPVTFVGRKYKRLAERMGSVQEAADKLGLTHQAVTDAIARYEAACKRRT